MPDGKTFFLNLQLADGSAFVKHEAPLSTGLHGFSFPSSTPSTEKSTQNVHCCANGYYLIEPRINSVTNTI